MIKTHGLTNTNLKVEYPQCSPSFPYLYPLDPDGYEIEI
jgi:hypothetical protein